MQIVKLTEEDQLEYQSLLLKHGIKEDKDFPELMFGVRKNGILLATAGLTDVPIEGYYILGFVSTNKDSLERGLALDLLVKYIKTYAKFKPIVAFTEVPTIMQRAIKHGFIISNKMKVMGYINERTI